MTARVLLRDDGEATRFFDAFPPGARKTGTAVASMLPTRISLRPMRSERWPAKGEAAKPAACKANRQAPTQKGE